MLVGLTAGSRDRLDPEGGVDLRGPGIASGRVAARREEGRVGGATAGVDDVVRRRHVEERPALHARALKRARKRCLEDAVGVLDDRLSDAGGDETERCRSRQLELGEGLRDRVEVAVRRLWAAEEKRQDVVV